MNYRVRTAKYILTVSILVVVFAIGADVCVHARIKELSMFAQTYPLVCKPGSFEFAGFSRRRISIIVTRICIGRIGCW